MDTKPAEINGTNIIGMFPGKFWGTQQDNPLIIGAHWDTTETTVGFNDNGSGVTVVLEIARILVSCENFNPDHSIIFVAFGAEEDGAIGSQEFINKILIPIFTRQNVKIQGAIILDTVFNFDSNKGL